MPGFISLHRDIQKHWIYQEERVFSRYEAWLDILMRVNYKTGKVLHNGTLETVPRGSTIWSLGAMEKHWKWSNRKVKRFLDCLVDDGMLTYKSTTKKTYLTVINYDFYQISYEKSTTNSPPTHNKSIQNNKLNNYTTAATEETLDEIHLKAFGKAVMSPLMMEYIQQLKENGHDDAFVKELMLETGESGNRPSLRFMQTIADRWERDGIRSREEAALKRPIRNGQASLGTREERKTEDLLRRIREADKHDKQSDPKNFFNHSQVL